MKKRKLPFPVFLLIMMSMPTVVILAFTFKGSWEEIANHPQQEIGIVKDASVIPTAFNEGEKRR